MSTPREIASAASLAVTALLVGGATIAAADSGRGAKVHEIDIEDDCEPATFDAVLGPGACVGDGDTTFDELFEELVEEGEHGKWRFHPDDRTIRRNDRLKLVGEGGEFHTFTEVPRFGPGCVPEINEAIGFGADAVPVVDCGLIGPTAVLPGQTIVKGPLSPGKHRFECLIHPWMRSTITVERRG